VTAQVTPHPVVPYRQLFINLAQKYIAAPRRRRLFLFFCRVWLWIARPAQGEARIEQAFARGENGFATKLRPLSRFFRPELAATMLMGSDADEPPARRAAKLIFATLQFRERALRDQLPVQYERDRPLDMEKYRNFFSLLVLSAQEGRKTAYHLVNAPPSEHIIVAVQGLYFQLKVLHADAILPVATLYEQLCQLVAEAQARLRSQPESRFPFGLFTSFQDRRVAALYAALHKDCPQTLEAINNALFWVSLDLDDRPDTLDRLCRTVHVSNYRYRDYRRSLQLVITGNGRAGIICDPNFGTGGAPMAYFTSEVEKACTKLDRHLLEPAGPPVVKYYEPLEFKTAVLTRQAKQLRKVEDAIQAKRYPEDAELLFRFADIKKRDFVRLGISVDGAMQLSIHQAFSRCFGQVPNVGSFISLHSIRHADISRYNATTPQVREFISRPSAATARAALEAHKQLIKQNKSGEEEVYQFGKKTMSLFVHHELRAIHLMLLFLILYVFIKDFKRRLLNQDVWVSSIPPLPGVAATGRAGVKLSFLAKPSLAGHYMQCEDHLLLCFLSNPGQPTYCGQEKRFADAIHASLRELLQLLDKPAGPFIDSSQGRIIRPSGSFPPELTDELADLPV
jgi:hypothetical protein